MHPTDIWIWISFNLYINYISESIMCSEAGSNSPFTMSLPKIVKHHETAAPQPSPARRPPIGAHTVHAVGRSGFHKSTWCLRTELRRGDPHVGTLLESINYLINFSEISLVEKRAYIVTTKSSSFFMHAQVRHKTQKPKKKKNMQPPFKLFNCNPGK